MGVSLSKIRYINSEEFNQDSKVFAKKFKKNNENYDKMDAENKKIMDAWEQGGAKVAVKEMFKGEGDKPLTYAEMRSKYG